MRERRLTGLLLLAPLLLLGCGPNNSHIVATADLPDDIPWLALLVSFDRGDPIGTGILRRGADGTIRALLNEQSRPPREYTLVGYRDATLLAIPTPDERTLRAGAISAARPTDPVLPRADFAESGPADPARGPLTAVDPRTLALTAPWLAQCPGVGTSTSIQLDANCSLPGVRCDATSHPIGPCEVAIDGSGCGLGTLTVALTGRHTLALENGGPNHCQSDASAVSDAAASLTCEGCTADIYLEAPDRFVVARYDLAEIAEYLPAEPRACNEISCAGFPADYTRLRQGHLSGLAAGGGRVAVVVNPEPIRSATVCPGTAPTQLTFFDEASPELNVIGTASAPPCLRALVADPSGLGWIGASIGRGASLIRFDLAGHERSRVAIPAAVSVRALRTAPGPSLALIAEGNGFIETVIGFSVGSSVSIERWRWLGDPHAYQLADLSFSGNRWVVVSDGKDALVRLDLAGGAELGLVAISDQGGSTPVNRITQGQANSQGVFALSSWEPTSMMLRTPMFRAAAFYPSAARSFALIPWPDDTTTFLVGLTRDADDVALVALYDPSRPRYLPGFSAVGRGAISEMVADAEGRVWAILPWSGSVVRIAAR